ncbi:hypothetical protein SMICM304S_04367 [Streptomyces microflavus]
MFPVSIHDAQSRGQSFGQVRNAFIRVVNRANGVELARYDLSEDASTETAMVFGELYRHGAEWKFRAVGQGYASGLARHRRPTTASVSDLAPPIRTQPSPHRVTEGGIMTINLSKGQQVSLTKSGGGELGVVRMGLGWKSAPRKGFLARLTARDIDLDASAVLFGEGAPGRRLLPAPHQRRRFGPAHR